MFEDLIRIKQLRQKTGLTQAQLAQKSGVSQSVITKIERGKIEPSYTIAKKIFITLEEELAKKYNETVARNICTKKIIMLNPRDTIHKAIIQMKKHAISQIPISQDNIIHA